MLKTKPDLANQMELSEESRQYLIISTHNGLFKQNHDSSSYMTNCNRESVAGVAWSQGNYVDDGRTETEHLRNLGRVFERLAEFGLKLNCEIYEFS